ncbi:MAG: polysaccharide biosynthesis PFTS motif protein [Pseudomonadota bacterium]
MQIAFIVTLLQKLERRRLRRVMRGYRVLKVSNKLDRIAAVKGALTNTVINQCERCASQFIFGAGFENAELIIRQYLLIRVGGLNLNKALLYSLGKPGSAVVYPLPAEWRGVLRRHGFAVNGFLSTISWYVLVSLMFANGALSIVKRIFASILELVHPSFGVLGRFAYFDTLIAGNLPQLSRDGRSYDIVTWYQRWNGRINGLDTLAHSVKNVAPSKVDDIPVVPIPSAIPPLVQLRALIFSIVWGVAASALALVDLFRSRWWHAFILNEAAHATQARLQHPHRLARVYLFHVSNYIYRPLWTYEAEKSGSQITCYFYSINCEPFDREGDYLLIPFGFQAMNWPHYLVWDEYQADFVYRAVGESADVTVVGPIWFHSSADEMQELPRNTVAVFDVQPMRNSRYQTLGLDFEYYTPKTANQFLVDIHHVVTEYGGTVALKRKRKIGKMAHPKYRKTVDGLEKLPNFIAVGADTAASRLIEGCAAVISMPFSSPALLGRELGKPSVYYDPHGLVQKNDRAAHGIPILSGQEELAKWLSAL